MAEGRIGTLLVAAASHWIRQRIVQKKKIRGGSGEARSRNNSSSAYTPPASHGTMTSTLFVNRLIPKHLLSSGTPRDGCACREAGTDARVPPSAQRQRASRARGGAGVKTRASMSSRSRKNPWGSLMMYYARSLRLPRLRPPPRSPVSAATRSRQRGTTAGWAGSRGQR
jgi:hypothetical protein